MNFYDGQIVVKQNNCSRLVGVFVGDSVVSRALRVFQVLVTANIVNLFCCWYFAISSTMLAHT